MFRSLVLAVAATFALASSAMATVVNVGGSSTANSYRLTWTMDWDDQSRDLTVNVTQTDLLTGLPSNGQCVCGVTVTLANNQSRSFDFWALGLLNAGPIVQNNVNAKSYLQRGGGSGLTFQTWYTPPAR